MSPPLVTPTFTGGRPSRNILSNRPLLDLVLGDQRVLQRRLEVGNRSRRAEVGRGGGVQRLLQIEGVQAVAAFVVVDERQSAASRPSFDSTTGESTPPSASVYWRSSPVLRLSDHRLKMLPLRATSGVSGVVGSVAVDEKISVSAFRNFAAASSCVPKVSCVFFSGVEIQPEQLLRSADAGQIDDEAAVGRVGRGRSRRTRRW